MWPNTVLECVPKASGQGLRYCFLSAFSRAMSRLFPRQDARPPFGSGTTLPKVKSPGSVWHAAMAENNCAKRGTSAHPPELHQKAIRSRCSTRVHLVQ
jgi:hypothetical protein